MTPIYQHVLKRHLRSIGKVERIAGQVTALVKYALREVLKHIPDRPHPSNMRSTLDAVQTIITRLRYAAALLVQDRLGELAAWGHLSMAKVLTRGVKEEPKPVVSEGIADYLKLIIRPPAKWFLKQLVGRAPELLTRLIDPDAASEIVLAGVAQGYDRKRIANDLTIAFGGYESAARRVVRTEGARVATESQISVSEEIPDIVVGYQINAVPKTEYSRPEHLKRSGTRYWRNPKGNQLGFDQMPRPPIDPPGVVEYNCLLPGNRVQGRFLRGWKAWYAGYAFELTCASGVSVRVTANHPVLTVNGFAPARSVRKGDYMARHISGIERASVQNEQEKPTLIEDVFGALAEIAGVVSIRPTVTTEFHGDAAFFKTNIDVVMSDDELRNAGHVSTAQLIDQCLLVGCGVGHFALKGQRSFAKNVSPINLPASLLVSRSDLSLPSVGICDPTPFGLFGLGLVANWDASFDQAGADCTTRNAKLIRHAQLRLASKVEGDKFVRREKLPSQNEIGIGTGSDGMASVSNPSDESIALDSYFSGERMGMFPSQIASDEVIEVRRFHYDGPVYDLESDIGYFTASSSQVNTYGAYLSNCRCYLTPLIQVDGKIV